jgi:hypothetical protein
MFDKRRSIAGRRSIAHAIGEPARPSVALRLALLSYLTDPQSLFHCALVSLCYTMSHRVLIAAQTQIIIVLPRRLNSAQQRPVRFSTDANQTYSYRVYAKRGRWRVASWSGSSSEPDRFVDVRSHIQRCGKLTRANHCSEHG